MNQLDLFDVLSAPEPMAVVVPVIPVVLREERLGPLLSEEELKAFSCYDWVTKGGLRKLWWKHLPGFARNVWQKYFDENGDVLKPDEVHHLAYPHRSHWTQMIRCTDDLQKGVEPAIAPSLRWVVSWACEVAELERKRAVEVTK